MRSEQRDQLVPADFVLFWISSSLGKVPSGPNGSVVVIPEKYLRRCAEGMDAGGVTDHEQPLVRRVAADQYKVEDSTPIFHQSANRLTMLNLIDDCVEICRSAFARKVTSSGQSLIQAPQLHALGINRGWSAAGTV
jgi:hypothetical protein